MPTGFLQFGSPVQIILADGQKNHVSNGLKPGQGEPQKKKRKEKKERNPALASAFAGFFRLNEEARAPSTPKLPVNPHPGTAREPRDC